MFERLRGLGVVEHLLKRLLHSQRLVDRRYRRVVGIREDGRWYLRLSQKILDFLPGLGAVPALREFLNTLDPLKPIWLGSPPVKSAKASSKYLSKSLSKLIVMRSRVSLSNNTYLAS